MKKRDEIVLEVISALLIVLFVYTAVSKLLAWRTFEDAMLNQPLPHALSRVLLWVLPFLELFVAGCLAFRLSRFLGFVLAFSLMLVFTGYVTLVLLNVFGRVPCSCGGVLQSLGWEEHLVFNVVFLILAGVGMVGRRQ